MSIQTDKTDGDGTRSEQYDAEIGYLAYDDTSDMLSLPMRLRERHLTEDTRRVFLQAVGVVLNVKIWSSRDNIIIEVPLTQYFTSDMRSVKLSGSNGGLISVGYFDEYIEANDGKVEVTVREHDYPEPDV